MSRVSFCESHPKLVGIKKHCDEVLISGNLPKYSVLVQGRMFIKGVITAAYSSKYLWGLVLFLLH